MQKIFLNLRKHHNKIALIDNNFEKYNYSFIADYAKKFNKCLSYFYFTYLILALFTKLIVLSLTFQNYDYFYIFVSFFIMLVDIWILKISAAFIHFLHDITEDERKNLQHIRIITTIHYW